MNRPALAAPLRFVLGALITLQASASWAGQSEQPGAESPPPPPPAPEFYMGRKIATTMHYSGAPWLVRESRQREEGTKILLKQLNIEPGITICDMGCGNGFYTIPMAQQTGEMGRVYAVDIQQEMLDMLSENAEAEGLGNIEGVLGSVTNPNLPDASIDLMIVVDVYHEMSHPVEMLAAIRKSLKPDGRLVLIEFRAEDPEVRIKKLHKMTKDQVKKELNANGFKLKDSFDGLPQQHMLTYSIDPEWKPVKTKETPAEPTTASANWPSFRGPGASGIVTEPLPTTWNVQDNTNIAWKTPIPGLAHSSPVIWGDRIFVTTAVRLVGESELSSLYGSPGYGAGDSVTDEGPHAFRIYCIDKHSGDVLWSRDAATGLPKVKRHPKSTHANPSPTCDAQRVIASFGSEGLFCYDHEGNFIWKRDFGVLNSGAPGNVDKDGYQWGFASSPILHDGRVIVQCDVENQSFLTVLDAKDGADIWRVNRDEDSTWSTPAILNPADGTPSQIIVNGYKHIGSYDLETGKEIWKLVGGGDVPVPTPLVSGDLIYITNAHGRLRPIYAIRTNATGLLTINPETCKHMAWSYPRRGVYMQTPIVAGDYLYCCSDGGILSCFSAATGKEIYRERLGSGGAGLSGSPIASIDQEGNGYLYFTSESGEIYVIRAGPEFEIVTINDMGETCMSTPAVSGQSIYIRSRNHLVSIKAP